MLATALKKALVVSFVLSLAAVAIVAQSKSKNEKVATGVPVIWKDPGRIESRNLTDGPGSSALAPVPPFTYVAEEKTGESPKFRVTDAKGIIWIVKMGPEAQAETVSSRIVWAVGYFADEAYHYERIEVKNLPRLTRGQEFVQNRTTVVNVRMEPKRREIYRGQMWDWEENPFTKTKELDGLKVLMVLLGNYDTSIRNNRVLSVKNEKGQQEARYVATDVGATLGKVGGLGGKRSKNTLDDYRDSKFILGVKAGYVEFDYDTTPKKMGAFASIFKPSYRSSQEKKERAMRTITVDNARWIGSLLARISDDQLRDAFRAAHYDESTMEGFIKAIRGRINELNRLGTGSMTVRN
jgi:hypothetical protein